VILSDIFGSADHGESPMHFCYSHQVAVIWEKKIGIRVDRNSHQVAVIREKKIGIRVDRNSHQVAMIWYKKIGIKMNRNSRQVAMIWNKKIWIRMDRKRLLLLLKREAVLRKIRPQGEDMVVKRD
jgi:hypothetical protein